MNFAISIMPSYVSSVTMLNGGEKCITIKNSKLPLSGSAGSTLKEKVSKLPSDESSSMRCSKLTTNSLDPSPQKFNGHCNFFSLDPNNNTGGNSNAGAKSVSNGEKSPNSSRSLTSLIRASAFANSPSRCYAYNNNASPTCDDARYSTNLSNFNVSRLETCKVGSNVCFVNKSLRFSSVVRNGNYRN